jgi:hypothetical protein
MAVESRSAHQRMPEGMTAASLAIADHDNDSLIIRLHMSLNHLSRWLTPITDHSRIERSVRRGEPSVMDLLKLLRDTELVAYSRLHAMANSINPDLDKLPNPLDDPARLAPGYDRSPLSVLSEFRRLRQSTCSLLRGLPDSAWARVGTSRREHDWQIRTMAEYLANNDLDLLYKIDVALQRAGLRQEVNTASGVHLDQLLKLYPVRPK